MPIFKQEQSSEAFRFTRNVDGESLLLPIVSSIDVALDEIERQQLSEIAARIAKQEQAIASTHAFGNRVRSGLSDKPWLIIGDTREIALSKPGREVTYEYRLSLLARPGDLVVFSREPHRDFERYRTQKIGLGPIVCINVQNVPRAPMSPLAERCRLDGAALAQIVQYAKQAGGLTVFPHIGMGSVWRLAATVAETASCDIRVASPPPRLTRLVNDKLWFARFALEILGENALPPTYAAHGPAILAHRIRSLAQYAERVVVKVPDSAGSAGNICLTASDVIEASLSDIKERILGVLRAAGWIDTYPLLVGIWEVPVLSSPSVQMWIPAVADGPPIIEGLFEQVLEGPEGSFVGSVPAELPEEWQRHLAHDAMRLTTVLQFLGYFGRCSLDALLVGRTFDTAALHWIECNGRWGGVSIPMTIVNRLTGGGHNTKFVVAQHTGESWPPHSFQNACQALNGMLFQRGQGNKGIVLLSPVEIEAGRGVQMLACAGKIAEARELLDRALEILLTNNSHNRTLGT